MLNPAQEAAFRRVRELLPDVRELRIPALHDDSNRWYGYKFTSLYEAIREVSLPGDYLQLGVHTGTCARFLAGLTAASRRLYLLDSFKGLPEDWIGQWKKGAFALDDDQIPRFEQANVEVVPGWFRDTIPGLVERLDRPLALIHADADLYSSTLDALDGLNGRIAPGTVIVFDEYFMLAGQEFKDDEHRALHDWCEMYGRRFEYLWKTEWVQVAVRITR